MIFKYNNIYNNNKIMGVVVGMKENHYGDDERQLDGGKGHKGNNWRGAITLRPTFVDGDVFLK